MVAVATRPAIPVDLATWARALGKVAFAGSVTGFLIGGVGGRLAMLVLRLTSSPELHGLNTDDGFSIGVISSETLFLLGVTTGLGLLAALVYAAVRTWFPRAWRPWIAAAFFGLVGGADLVSTGGIDFRILEPLGLAIAMFVAIPTMGAFLIAWWIERWLASEHVPRPGIRSLWPLIAFAGTGPIGLMLLLVLIGGWAVAHNLPWLERVWRSRPVPWIGRAALVVPAVIAAFELVDDATVILAR